MIGSLVEMIIGATGVIHIILRFIGPLMIAPTVALLGLSFFRVAASFASKNWYIAMA